MPSARCFIGRSKHSGFAVATSRSTACCATNALAGKYCMWPPAKSWAWRRPSCTCATLTTVSSGLCWPWSRPSTHACAPWSTALLCHAKLSVFGPKSQRWRTSSSTALPPKARWSCCRPLRTLFRSPSSRACWACPRPWGRSCCAGRTTTCACTCSGAPWPTSRRPTKRLPNFPPTCAA